jgi:hypothetical protein
MSAGGEKIHMTISIGLSMLDHQDQESDINCLAEQLIARADKAVYQAKHQGRNQVVSDGLTRPCNPRRIWSQPSTWLGNIPLLVKKILEPGLSKLRPARSSLG